MKSLFATIAALVIASLAPTTLAGSPAKSLRKATPCEYETLFRQGTLGCGPAGTARGTVLSADGKLPRIKARLQGAIWKGKTFHGDGTFTNRWLGGISAGTACVQVGTSWLDGQDCFVLTYPPDATVFRNVRDEFRQIAPDLWIGRSYDATTGQSKNWFLLSGK